MATQEAELEKWRAELGWLWKVAEAEVRWKKAEEEQRWSVRYHISYF